MYIIKNAIKNIQRSLGKNILIGFIIFIIGLSCCLSLSIKQAAQTTRDEGLNNLNVTASISFDRKKGMQDMQPPTEGGEVDKSQMKEMFQQNSLSLSELETYAKAKSVKDFFYTGNISLNGSTAFSAISNSSNEVSNVRGGMPEMSSGDFSLIGYSSYDAMSDFISETKTMNEGKLFAIDSKNECIISDELAIYNSLSVGDSITLINPNNEAEITTLLISGTYTSSESDQMGMQLSDPANQIYTNYKVVNTIVDASSEESKLNLQTNGTYQFNSVKDYEKFETQARDLGLDDTYTITSNDISAYEKSMAPLTNLAQYATTFLWIILAIGGGILIVFNIFRLKERKYEIGVLAAIGMNKSKIAFQFMCELLIVTLIAMILGIGIGSVTSVPLTNTLLANTDTSTTFETQSNEAGGAMNKMNMEIPNQNINYIESVSSATNINVMIQLLGITIILTIISSLLSILFILRYEPLKILTNRE